jgi:hypothetical protein
MMRAECTVETIQDGHGSLKKGRVWRAIKQLGHSRVAERQREPAGFRARASGEKLKLATVAFLVMSP